MMGALLCRREGMHDPQQKPEILWKCIEYLFGGENQGK